MRKIVRAVQNVGFGINFLLKMMLNQEIIIMSVENTDAAHIYRIIKIN